MSHLGVRASLWVFPWHVRPANPQHVISFHWLCPSVVTKVILSAKTRGGKGWSVSSLQQQKSTASSRRNRSPSGPPTTSPRETTWWTSACHPPPTARGGANCSAVRTCNPWQNLPPHLGRLRIEIHSVGVLPSCLGCNCVWNLHFLDQWSQFSLMPQTISPRKEVLRIDFKL